MYFYGPNAVISSDFPFLALLDKFHFAPQDGRTQTVRGRTVRLLLDRCRGPEESDYEAPRNGVYGLIPGHKKQRPVVRG